MYDPETWHIDVDGFIFSHRQMQRFTLHEKQGVILLMAIKHEINKSLHKLCEKSKYMQSVWFNNHSQDNSEWSSNTNALIDLFVNMLHLIR